MIATTTHIDTRFGIQSWRLWGGISLVWLWIAGAGLAQTVSTLPHGSFTDSAEATVAGGAAAKPGVVMNSETIAFSDTLQQIDPGVQTEGKRDLSLALLSMSNRRIDNAQRLFESYIDRLPKKEQRPYQDIVFIAQRDDLARYRRAPEDRKQAMARRLWNRCDPAPLTRANERLVEHYRRVSHARTYFSEDGFPWDARGEVYVRFGPPDHISRSGNIRPERTSTVQDARHWFANRFFSSFEVRPGYPTFPTRGDSAWEYWVYTDLDGGLEFTFTAPRPDGRYTFAPVPMGLSFQDTRLLEANGGALLERLTAVQPSRYTPNFSDLPVDFTCDPISFRGSNGRTRLEISCGLPASDAVYLKPDDQTGLISLERGLALYDSLWNEVHRVQDRISLNPPTEQQILEGAFIPSVIRTDLAPGVYYMALQIRDAASGKSRVYHREVVLEDYADRDALCLSEVQLAFSVSPADSGEDDVKQGLRVIPQASRTFRTGQHAFVYFEVYNLSRDAFGQTRYQVEYTLAAQQNRSTPARVLRGLGQLVRLTGKEEEVLIAFDQAGDRPDEAAYIALDLTQTEPGDQLVRVTVTDLQTDREVSREAAFEVLP